MVVELRKVARDVTTITGVTRAWQKTCEDARTKVQRTAQVTVRWQIERGSQIISTLLTRQARSDTPKR